MNKRASEMRIEARHQMRNGSGAALIRHLREDFSVFVRLCAHLTLHPGSSIGMHKHENEDELFVFLKGTGLLDDGTTKCCVQPGDASLARSGESHALLNVGSEDLEVMAVIIEH